MDHSGLHFAKVQLKFVLFFFLCFSGGLANLHDRIDAFLARYNGGKISRNLGIVSYEDMMHPEAFARHRKKRTARAPGEQFDWRIEQVLAAKNSSSLEMFIDHWGVGDNDGRCLFVALYYIMHHKFYNIDWRKFRGRKKPNLHGMGKRYSKYYYRVGVRKEEVIGVEEHLGFHSNFPQPVIENWPSELVEACTDSVHRCVREIAYVANQNDELYLLLHALEVEWPTRMNFDINVRRRKFVYTDIWRRVRKFIDIGHEPWKNREAAFAFTTVASYFLCFYVLQREGFLISLPFDPNCHRLMIYSMKGYAEVRFGCSELAFCADPCWGESKYGYDIVLYEFESGIRMAKPTNNPCWQMKGGRNNMCNFLNAMTQQVSFMDLQMGRMNYSCNCTKGFQYSMITRQCEDIDECLDTVLNTCNETLFEICRNTIGTFHCSCLRGYRAESENAPCKRDNLTNVYNMTEKYGYLEGMQEKRAVKSGDKLLKKIHDIQNLPWTILEFFKDKLVLVFPQLKHKFQTAVTGD